MDCIWGSSEGRLAVKVAGIELLQHNNVGTNTSLSLETTPSSAPPYVLTPEVVVCMLLTLKLIKTILKYSI